MRWKSPWVWLALVWMVGVVAYASTFTAPFVFDDLVEILNNPPLHNFDVQKLAERYPTRIVPYLTLAANYAVSREHTTSYHVVNTFIHLLTATVIFFLVRELAGITKYGEQKYLLAGASALLFVSHPIQTQAVTYTIQRLASLTTFFYLSGLLFYILARRGPSTSLPPVRRAGRVSNWNWLHIVAWLAILLAMFSKEIAFTAPIAILMVEWFFFREDTRQPYPILRPPLRQGYGRQARLRGAGGLEERADMLLANGLRKPSQQGLSRQELDSGRLSQSANRTRGDSTRPEQVAWQIALFYLSLLLVIPLMLWFGRPPLVERDNPLVENALPQPGRPLITETSSITRIEYFFTQINVVRTYLRLLILPINQNLDYDYPISHSLFEARTFSSLILLLAILELGIWLYSKNRLASFGIFFFFLALSVESSAIPIRDVIFEHRLYLPSFGIFLAAAALAISLLKKRVGLLVFAVIVMLLTGATVARNRVWQSEEMLWTDVVAKSPAKARGYNNLGVTYTQQGDYERAEERFSQALARNSSYAEAYNNLGLLKAQQGDYEAASELFRRAVELEPLYVHAFNNLGVAYLKQNKPQEAIAHLEMAVGTDDTYIDAKVNLAIAYLNNKESDKARKQVEIILEQEPNNEKAQQLLQQINS